MKRIALYLRVSTPSQSLEMQRHDLQRFASERGYTIVREYSDIASGAGARAKRPGLAKLLSDVQNPNRGFDGIAVWAADRLCRSVQEYLSILDLFRRNNADYISVREGFTTEGPMGRAFTILVGMMAEVERSILVSRIKSGMEMARLQGRRIGRAPLHIDRELLLSDRERGLSLSQLAKTHKISKASVCRILRAAKAPVSMGCMSSAPTFTGDKELTQFKMTA